MEKFYLSLILIILIIAGVSAYFFLEKKEDLIEIEIPESSNQKSPLNRNSSSFQSSVLPQLQIEKISPAKVISPTLNENSSKIIYYNPESLSLEEIDFKKENSPYNQFLSLAKFEGINKILWSPEKDKLIVFWEKEGQIQKTLYNPETQEGFDLHQNIKNIAFSPEGEKIVYQFYNSETGENKISVASTEILETEILEEEDILNTKILDIDLYWPSENKIFLWQNLSGVLEENDLYQFDLVTKNPPLVVLPKKFGFKPKWSESGKLILFSEVPSLGEEVSLNTLNNEGEIKNLKISSLVEKCAFDKEEKSLYCGIPKNLAPDIILPDDYYKNLFQSQDNLFKINLETGEKIQLTKDAQHDILEPFLSADENHLFFTNKKDGALYSIQLE